MTRSQYASTITPPLAQLTTITGNLSRSVTYSVWLYCRNRAGVTLHSDRSEITIVAGQGIRITLPAEIKVSGSSYQYVGVLLGEDSNPNNSCVVATYPYSETLPATIELYEDAHVELNGTVATSSDLTAISPIHGMRRYISDLGVIKEYNFFTNSWQLFYPQTFNPLVGDTTGTGGADIDLISISDPNDLIVADYNSDGEPSEPVQFWIVNDTSVDIPQGTRIRLSSYSSGNETVRNSDFAGLLEVEFLGYVDTTTAILDTTDMTVGGYIPYENLNLNTLVLPKSLPPNNACVIGVRANFASYALANTMLQGELIQLYPYFAPYYSEYNPAGSFLGDHLEATGDRRRVVPNGTGLSLLALSGSGTVKRFHFEKAPEQEVFALAANTDNQQVVITNNGTCYVANTLPATAALRAVVSTIDGVGSATTPANLALDANSLLEITFTHPTTIRADYPDAIASATATLNADTVRVYVNLGNWSYWNVAITGEENETITVGDTPGIAIAAVEVPPVNFGLFIPEVALTASSGTSVFSTGTAEVRVAYLYQNTVTAISHSREDGCLNERLVPYGELSEQVANTVEYWGQRVANVAQLQSMTYETGLRPYKTYLAGDSYYYYDPLTLRNDNLFYYQMVNESGAMIRAKLPLLLSQNITWYVSPTGSTAEAGYSLATPTLWSEVAQRLAKIDLNNFDVVVYFAKSTTESDRIIVPAVKGQGSLTLTTESNATTATYPILAAGLEASNLDCAITLGLLNIQAANARCVQLENCAQVFFVDGVDLAIGGTTQAALWISNCQGSILNYLNLKGNASNYLHLTNNSFIKNLGANLGIGDSPTISDALLRVDNGAIFDLGNTTLTGNFTGKKYIIDRGFVKCEQDLDAAIVNGTAGEILNPQIGHSFNTLGYTGTDLEAAIAANTAAILANTTAIANNAHTVYAVANISARDALTNLKNNDLALVTDADGFGNGANFIWNGSAWLQYYDLVGAATVNNVYEVADLAARDALINLVENDIAKVADDGTGNPRDYVWNGSAWLAYVGSAGSSGVEVYEVADIATRDALTNLVEGDISKVADDGTGNPKDYVWNGSTWLVYAGSSSLEVSDGTNSATNVDKITVNGGVVSNDGNGDVTLTVGIAATDAVNTVSAATQFQFTGATVTNLGSGQAAIAYNPAPGTFLFPNTQFDFSSTADTTDITTITPVFGASSFQDIKILTTANNPDNQIISGQLVIAEVNTGIVFDAGLNSIALRVGWLVEAGVNLVFICRYDSDGNMVIVELSETAIALSTVVADTVTAITPITAFSGSFTVGNTYDLQLYVAGGLYSVIVADTVVFEAVSSEFIEQTYFGIGRR